MGYRLHVGVLRSASGSARGLKWSVTIFRGAMLFSTTWLVMKAYNISEFRGKGTPLLIGGILLAFDFLRSCCQIVGNLRGWFGGQRLRLGGLVPPRSYVGSLVATIHVVNSYETMSRL